MKRPPPPCPEMEPAPSRVTMRIAATRPHPEDSRYEIVTWDLGNGITREGTRRRKLTRAEREAEQVKAEVVFTGLMLVLVFLIGLMGRV